MSIATAAAALRDADEALAAAKVIRAEACEALLGAVVADGWRIVYRHKDVAGHARIVLEHHLHRGSMDLEGVVAHTLREAVA